MKKIHAFIFLLSFQLFFTQFIFAGDANRRIESPKGEALSTSRGFYWEADNVYVRIVATTKDVWLEDVYQPGKSTLLLRVDKDLTIASVTEKLSSYTRKGRTASAIIVTLSDNSIIILDKDGTDEEIDASVLTVLYSTSGEFIKDMAGDDMYVITNSHCLISKDSARTWQFDTAGIKGKYFFNLSMDSAQRIYLSSNGGLYTQELGAALWTKNAALSGTNCAYVYVDRFQNIWAKTNTGFYVSTNRGLSFSNAPSNSFSTISSMTDDIYGNRYVLSGNIIYKSVGGIQPFTRIDGGLLSQIKDPVDFQTFKQLSADTFLFVSSKYGFFTSYDQGNNWIFKGLPSNINYGIAKTSSGRLLVSNNTGIHTKESNQTNWTQCFPSSGFKTTSKIFKINNGDIYTTSNNNKLIWKSTDGGNSWSLDTLSYNIVSGNISSFYVDPTGTQHAYVLAGPPVVFCKKVGGNWQTDIAGFKAAIYSNATAWGTDNNGNLYLATASVYLQKRPITGGTWVTDTAGLTNDGLIYDLAVEANGTLWAGTYIGAFKKNGSVWQQLVYPAGTKIGVSNSCFALSVDGAGAVWTQWSYFNTIGHSIGSGVYFTQDGGNKWSSMDFDTITFRQLYSVGDTTYAVSYTNGLYQFTRDGALSSVKEIKGDKPALIKIYPNPGNGDIQVQISQTISNIYHLMIYDQMGKQVFLNTFSGNSVNLHLKCISSGIYTVYIPEYNYTHKLVVGK